MSYIASGLHLRGAGAPGALLYFYSTADNMADLLVYGYFQNVTYLSKFVVGDQIYCQCADGNFWLEVGAVDNAAASAIPGAVHVLYAGGDLPIQVPATGTAVGDAKLRVGFTEVGTSISTATRFVLPSPYPGAVVQVRKVGSGTEAMAFDAGGSAVGISIGSGSASIASLGGGTGVTYDGTRRRITLLQEGNGFRVRATSTTRWRIEALDFQASAVSEGASVVMLGT